MTMFDDGHQENVVEPEVDLETVTVEVPVRQTAPEDVALKTAASRLNSINILWEVTQAALAISLAFATIYVSVIQGIPESETLKNALFVVLGFYFGRTNHTRPVLDLKPRQDEEQLNV